MDVASTWASHARLAVLLIVSGAFFTGLAGALKCLQCMDPGEGGDCVHDYMGLVNISLGIFPNDSRPYYKECTATMDYCVIETFYEGGVLKSFIRDCSDGGNFSFTGEIESAKLSSVMPDNFTTCIYRSSARLHICITLCLGDFCNAPRPPPNDTQPLDPCNSTDSNATCSAQSLLFGTSGPFGPTVDQLLGRAYLLPVLTAVLCLQIFG